MQQLSRLLHQLEPTNYQITLDVTHKSHVKGSVRISAQRKNKSDIIRLHIHELHIDSVRVNGQTSNYRLDEDSDELVISVTQTTDRLLLIDIDYSFNISPSLNGLYRAEYSDKVGDKKYLLVTQCESHHAREIFPCIDEPAAKASIQLVLTHPTHEKALSNTDSISIKSNGSSTTTTFDPTPKMSTYLFAFVVGELVYTESITKNGVRIRTYATKDNISRTTFATKVASSLMDMYEAYFDVPYALNKCDLVAVPDFAAGAMENWGLITYRETELLYDKKLSNLETKQSIVTITAHELAHMWFGNLVTMAWWDDLWLNEGFASFMETYMSDKLYPEWRLWDQFVTGMRQNALKNDALVHTHPIVMKISHPDEITAAFDAISYEKSAACITMLHNWLGDRAFKSGIREYITRHAYQNTTSSDLWKCLSTDKKDVRSFMTPWIQQKGYPLVRVKELRNGELEISQQRFTYEDTRDSHIWPIPLFDGSELLQSSRQRFESDTWNVDINLRGFYRVVYDSKLLNESNLRRLGAMSQVGRVSDAFESTKAGDASIRDALLLVSRLTPFTHQPLWELIANEMGHVRSVFATPENKPLFKQAYLRLAKEEVHHLGWTPKQHETHADALLRPLVLAFASYGGDTAVVNKSLRIFDKADSSTELNAHTRGIVLATVARERNETSTYTKLLEWYRSAPSDELRHDIALAMTSFSSPRLIMKILKLIESSLIKQQDVVFWILYLLSNTDAKTATWEWIKKRWSWITTTLDGEVYFSSFPYYIARNFARNDFLEDYRDFFSPLKSNLLLKTSIEQGEETIRWQSHWYEKEVDHVESSLRLIIDKN